MAAVQGSETLSLRFGTWGVVCHRLGRATQESRTGSLSCRIPEAVAVSARGHVPSSGV